MKRAGILSVALAVFLAVSQPVWAEENAAQQHPSAAVAEHATETPAGGHESGGALPQLDVALYPGIVFWFVLSFFSFFLVMQMKGVPGIQKTQEKRASILGADLEAARRASEEAQKVVSDYETALAKARQEAQATVNAILIEAEKEAGVHSEKLHAELEHRTKVAEENILAARQKAMEETPKFINDLVVELFGKVTKVSIGARG